MIRFWVYSVKCDFLRFLTSSNFPSTCSSMCTILHIEINDGGHFYRDLDSNIILNGKSSFWLLTTTTELLRFLEALISSTQLPSSLSKTRMILVLRRLEAKEAVASDHIFCCESGYILIIWKFVLYWKTSRSVVLLVLGPVMITQPFPLTRPSSSCWYRCLRPFCSRAGCCRMSITRSPIISSS